MSDPSLTPSPDALAYVLARPKLQRRLRQCLHTPVRWDDAPKSHRQLRELELVYFGETGAESVALATPQGQHLIRMLDNPSEHGLAAIVVSA